MGSVKKFLSVAAVVLMLLAVLAACGGGETEAERMEREELELMQGVVDTMLGDLGIGDLGEVEEAPADSNADFAPLNLPLVTQDTTYNGFYRITSGGVLQRRRSANWDDIDTNVRSVYSNGHTTFFIKNDNSLWGYGSNQLGRLGDGTGVDRDRPVHILDNVATLYGASAPRVILTDGTSMYWGFFGQFYPALIPLDNVIGFIGQYVHTGEGFIYRLPVSGSPERVVPFPVYGATTIITALTIARNMNPHPVYYINSDNVLVRVTARAETAQMILNDPEELAAGVVQLLSVGRNRERYQNILFLKEDGTLWGVGLNSEGELGDGTRVPRDMPVQIAENVADVGSNTILKNDGTLWTWDSSNPTPQRTGENVAALSHSIHYQDGRVFNGINWFYDVKIPQTRTW